MSVSSSVKWDDDINVNVEEKNAHKAPDSCIMNTQKVDCLVLLFREKEWHDIGKKKIIL